MYRRIYLLLPDEEHARTLAEELPELGVPANRIHAVTREGETLKSLPAASNAQRRDLAGRLETVLWNVNLGVFGLALLGLVAALYTGHPGWAVAMAAVMVATFVAGLLFTYLPNVHLRDLRPALAHGEVLLMVDVPKGQVHAVEERARRHHPEAVVGGVSWSSDAFGL